MLIFTGTITSLKAQDPSFSQAYYNPLYLNPAFAGTNDGLRIFLNHRNQWNYIPGQFNTSTFSMDVHELLVSSGFAVTGMRDVAGEGFLTTSKMGFTYAWGRQFKQDRLYMSFGLSGNFVQKSIDWNKLEFSDQFDPVYGKMYASGAEPPHALGQTFFDPDFGVLFKWKTRGRRNRYEALWNAGFSVHHLTRPDESFMGTESRLPERYTLHGGVLLPMGMYSPEKGAFVFPHIVLRKQAQMEEILAAIYGFRNPLLLGIGYHNRRAPIEFKNTNALFIVAGYQRALKNDYGFQIAYSYDLNLSGLNFSTYGSHEISFNLFFDGASLLGSGRNGADKESNCLKIRRKGFIPQF